MSLKLMEKIENQVKIRKYGKIGQFLLFYQVYSLEE
jgi:hypothetical protein